MVCGRNRIGGFDLVEVNPLYDPAEITGLLASQLIVEAIGFIFTP
ncbi:MAG: arginase family protein [Proteobacteria bacterium]|nr:arginase family protein [Pseudomonadota bacterium]